MKPKFNIGDEVFVVTRAGQEKWVMCPECGGTRTLKVTFFDGTEASIDCVECAPGLRNPQGVISKIVYTPRVERRTVKGLTFEDGRFIYDLAPSGWREEEDEIYSTQEDAENIGYKTMLAEIEANEKRTLYSKEKNHRTWAWNATYYRKQIKKAQKDIEFYTAKLNVASVKAKEDKKNDSDSN